MILLLLVLLLLSVVVRVLYSCLEDIISRTNEAVGRFSSGLKYDDVYFT